jgi:hypothetical protein
MHLPHFCFCTMHLPHSCPMHVPPLIVAMREGFSNLMSGVAGAVLEKSKADMEVSLLLTTDWR